MIARSLFSTPVHACSSSLTKAQHSSPFQLSELAVTVSACACHLLGIPQKHFPPHPLKQNRKDISKQEEFFSVLQLYPALVDTRIKLFVHLESVIYIQDFDSILVRTGMVIGDTQSQQPPCGNLHQQEV